MQNKAWRYMAAAAAAAALWAGSAARADDSFPPCWRNKLGTTYQSWSFVASNNPAAPEAFNNPNGVAQLTFAPGAFSKGWKDVSFGTETGVWDLGQNGGASLTVSNYGGSPVSWEYVQVQVTYFEDSLVYRPPTVSIPGATFVSSAVTNNQTAAPGAWKTLQSVWLMQPAPTSETILLQGVTGKGLLIGQVIVDTRSPLADDGDVPAFKPCWRGQPGSTFQHWTFGVSNNPASIPADFTTNTYGTASASLVLGPFSSEYILEDNFLGCRQGLWDMGDMGTMSFSIPNSGSGSAGSYKYVQVQVTQYRDGIYDQNATVSIAGGVLVSQQQVTLETVAMGRQWIVHQSVWRLGPPSPTSETVVVTAGPNSSIIDQVVVDTMVVDVVCPGNIAVNADAGQCTTANVGWVTPALNGCTVASVVCRTNGVVVANPNTFPVGITPVVCVVADSLGGTSTCNFNVTVTDAEAPTVTCPTDLVAAKDPSLCGAVVTFAASGADNCSGVTTMCTPASGSVFPLGVTTVSCVAQDQAGNSSAPCSFQVRVIDFTGDLAAFKPCWRGGPNTTFQQWAFSVSNNPAAIPAERVTNSYGVPAGVLAVGPFSSEYIDQDPFIGCRQGIWDMGIMGTLTLNLPNTSGGPASSYKYVRVQVTQYRDGLYNENADVSVPGGVLVSQQQQTLEPTNAFGGIWVVEKSVFRLGPPAPGSESVVITAGINSSLIDQVVVDTETLDFVCPGNISVSADIGQCSKANVGWVMPGIDGCNVSGVICTTNGVAVSNPATFAVGTTPVACVLTDGEGGTFNCGFNVTVTDNELPVASCKNITIDLDGMGQASIIASQIDNGSTDNCGIASLAASPNTFTCANLGANNVTLTVTDLSGNVATCTAVVTVRDQVAPVLTGCPADASYQCLSLVPAPATVTALDNCNGSVAVSFAENQSSPGGSCNNVITRTWTAMDAQGNTVSCTQTITVNDTTKPVVTLVGANPQIVECHTSYTELGATASDNCGGDLTSGIVINSTAVNVNVPGDYSVSYNVADACGNAADTVTRIVRVVDTTKPVITLTGANPQVIECHTPYMELGATAADSCAGDLTSGIVVNSSSVNANAVGNYTVTYDVVDPSGNAAVTVSRTVQVVDTTPPMITLMGADPMTVECHTSFSDPGAVAADVCAGDISSSIMVTGTVDANTVGSYTLTYTVSDGANTATATRTVNVVDTTQPVITLAGANPQVIECHASYVELGATAADTCAGDLTSAVVIDSSGVNVNAVGTYTVTYNVSDPSGNAAAAVTRTVQVVDTTAPSIVCSTNIIANASGPGCAATVSYSPTVSDACDSAAQVNCVPPSGSSFSAGVTTVQCTAVDASGNSSSCSFTVTVQPLADVMVSVETSPQPLVIGSELLYTITVSNQGPCTATNVVLSNYLSTGQLLLSVTNGWNVPGQGYPTPGPVAWWPAEGSATDVIGGNDGSAFGDVTFSAGEAGQAFHFDGLTGYITVPDAPALRPTSLTVEGWIKIQDPNGVHVVVSKPLAAATADSYSIWIGSGVLYAAVSDNAGSGPFLSYPEFPTSSIFVVSDIVDLEPLALKLKQPAPSDGVSQFIRSQLSFTNLVRLTNYVGGPDEQLQKGLVGDFNRIIKNGAIYEPSRFMGVTLSPETQYVLGRNPQGQDLVRLNRMLIRDAYAQEITSNLFPQLNEWYHFAFTYDQATHVQALYVNGALVATTFVNKDVAYDGQPLMIGADNDNGSPGYFYQGNVDELSLYDRALSGSEVRAIYLADGAGKISGPNMFAVGDLPSGGKAIVTLVTQPTECGNVSVVSTVVSGSSDLNLGNNTGTASATPQERPDSEVVLTIAKVSRNNNALEICWPITCGPYMLQSATSLTPPANVWAPFSTPIQRIGTNFCTVINADEEMKYFRLVKP